MTAWSALWLGLILALAGCGHAAPAPAPARPAAAPDPCEAVADHVVSLMSAAAKVDSVQLDPFRNVITRRCTQDGWSAAARRCLLGTRTLADGDACKAQLSPAQVEALQRDGQDAVSKLPAPGGEAGR